MGKPYTKQEVEALRRLRAMAGGHLTYYTAAALEELFFEMTGRRRASGALYMAAWRDELGIYEHFFVETESSPPAA